MQVRGREEAQSLNNALWFGPQHPSKATCLHHGSNQWHVDQSVHHRD